MPLISIVIPTLNRPRELARAIESVRAQTLRDLELIVVDDGSTDDIGAVLEQFAAPDIRLTRHEK